MSRHWNRAVLFAGLIGVGSHSAAAQDSVRAATYVPALASLLNRPTSELRTLVERFTIDIKDLNRRWPVDYSPAQMGTFRGFQAAWQTGSARWISKS